MLDLTYETPKPKVIAGAKHDWELVIGMEVHAQVASQAKLFSGASTKFGAEPNSNVSFVDAAMPGMLPVINEFCVAQAVRTGLGLKAEINLWSAFDRKNYFYPDLPQGYQISQYKQPIVGEGEVEIAQRIEAAIERAADEAARRLDGEFRTAHTAKGLIEQTQLSVDLIEALDESLRVERDLSGETLERYGFASDPACASPGPACGSSPWAKTIGKMARPASSATSVSAPAMMTAARGIEMSRER